MKIYRRDLEITDKDEMHLEVDHYLTPVEVTDIVKKIEEIEDLHPYKQAGNADSYSSYNEGWADACDLLGEAIMQLLTNNK